MMRGLVLFIMMLLAAPVYAVSPSEVLSDPVLEGRARNLSSGLRCLVCQNQSIDDSDAELAHDLRVLVRERLVAGDTDGEVLDYVVDRYGEFVLLKPRFSVRTALLWATPVVVLLLGLMMILIVSRRRRAVGASQKGLSAKEERDLQRLLDERE